MIQSLENISVALWSLWHNVDHAKNTVLLQADVVRTFLAKEGHWFGEPWSASSAFDGLFDLIEDEGLWVRVDELKEWVIAEVITIVDNGCFLSVFQDLEAWEALNFILLDQFFLLGFHHAELKSFLAKLEINRVG